MNPLVAPFIGIKIIQNPYVEKGTMWVHPDLYKLIKEAMDKTNEERPNIR